jgi:PAS domain S-box-containing protein
VPGLPPAGIAMKFTSTLRRTLSLHFLLVTILPALLFGLLATSLLQKHLESGIYERNQVLSQDIAAAAEQFLSRAETSLGTVAKVVENGTIIQPGSVDAYLEMVVQRLSWIESIYILDDKRHIRYLGLDARASLRRDDYQGFDFSHHALFEKHANLEMPVWSDTFVSLVTGMPSVTLAIPIKGGILLGNISLQDLSHQLARFSLDRNDNCAIIDHIGTLIASNDPVLVTQRVNFGHHTSVRQALSGQGKTIMERHADIQILESTTEITRTGWVAWVGVDYGAKMRPVEHIRDILIAIMLMSMVLAAGVALVDAHRLMRPLSTLSERAGQIGSGQYEANFPPSGFVEIDSLASGLKDMSQAIRDREASLINSEQRFRDLVNSIDGVVWEMDMQTGNYLFVSEQSAAMFGHPPARWLEDPDFWSSHVHPDDFERVVIRGRHSLALDDKHDLEYRFLTASGAPLWVRDLVTVVWEDDEPRRLLGVIIDTSARKKAEEELQHYRSHLEELVAQRTLELQKAQGELVEKERLAVLGQLTATVSHEIRNPLGTVANSLYLIREVLDRNCLAKVERPLALADRSVQRCDGIISELLDFTRQRELRCEPVKIDAWLAGMLEEMVWPPGVKCCWNFGSGAVVTADPERLRRALVNVITNALQAMEGKDGDQTLEALTRTHGNRCEIIVKDSGGGIPAEIMERIFEPLFSTKNFGVGLGVPIIRNIMEDHGGGVEYRSKVGEGTVVTLWLPLSAATTTTTD